MILFVYLMLIEEFFEDVLSRLSRKLGVDILNEYFWHFSANRSLFDAIDS